MRKYTWEFSDNVEIWRHDVFNTVEECVKDYLENYADEQPQETIFVGEAVSYFVSVDGPDVLERLGEQAYSDCGEVAENWYPSSNKNVDDLSSKLTDVVVDWLKENNEMPDFYMIENIRKVNVRELEGLK